MEEEKYSVDGPSGWWIRAGTLYIKRVQSYRVLERQEQTKDNKRNDGWRERKRKY